MKRKRRLIAGFLFGTTGALIALSPVGKISGAHINAAVTMGFWLFRKLDARTSITYVMGQSAGAIAGALPLLAWGSMGRSVAFGATLLGKGYAISGLFLGEVVTTFIMVTLLTLFLAFRQVRNFTPAIFPPLYSLMLYWEAPIPGTSTNPARSLVPAVVSQEWMGWCIFWAEPILLALVAALLCSLLAKRITVAKLYHFDSDRDRIFRRT
jgi:aquaporin Z